jgi:hypothetical protein
MKQLQRRTEETHELSKVSKKNIQWIQLERHMVRSFKLINVENLLLLLIPFVLQKIGFI